MAPTLREGQLALTRKLGPAHRVRRGDVVVVDSAVVGGLVVKRVIGLPGEAVRIHDGHVSIDGHVLPEPYAARSVFSAAYMVPPEGYFLLGDNRDASIDSRTWDQPFVDRSAIRGRLLGRPAVNGRRVAGGWPADRPRRRPLGAVG